MIRSLAGLAALLASASAAQSISSPALVPVPYGGERGPVDADQDVQVLAAHDAGFVAVWEDSRRSHHQQELYGARLSPGGAVLDPRGIRLVSGPALARGPRLACGAGLCLLAWFDDVIGTRALRLSPRASGLVPLDATPFQLAPVQSNLALAFSGSGFLAFTKSSNGTELVVRHVGLDGTVGAPRTLVTEPQGVRGIEAAFNGREVLVAWQRAFATRDAIRVATVDTAGTTTGATTTLTAAGILSAVASNADGWLVTWLDSPSSFGDVHEARVSSDGGLTGTSTLATGTLADPDLAWDGQRYLVVWHDNSPPLPDLAARPVDPLAGPLGPAWNLKDSFTYDFEPTVAAVGPDVVLVVRSGADDANDLLVAPLPADGGRLSRSALVPLTVAGEGHQNPRAIFDGQQYQLTFRAVTTGPDGRAATLGRTLRLDVSGAAIGPPLELAGGTSPQTVGTPAFDGQRLLVPWRNGKNYDLRAAFVDRTGTGLGAPLVIGATSSSSMSVPVAATHDGVQLVAWREFRSSNEVYVRRLRAGQLLDAAPAQVSAGDAADPTVVSVPGGFLVLWPVAVNLPQWSLQARFVGVDGVLGPLQAPVRNPSRPQAPAAAAAGNEVLVVFRDTDGATDNTVRAVRLDAQGRALAEPLTLLASADTPGQVNPGSAAPTVAYDGVNYLVAFEVDAPDSGLGDLWLRSVHLDGGLGPLKPLSSSPQGEEQPALTAGPIGQALLAYVEYEPEPGAGVLRLRTRVLSEIPQGFSCRADAECQSGLCQQVCCSADGGCAPSPDAGAQPDAGTQPDGGGTAASPRTLTVQCGCSAAGATGPALLLLALVSIAARRAARPAAARRA